MAGVSVSAVKQWRQKPEYQAELARLSDVNAEVISEAVTELRENVVNSANQAVTALVNQLDAEDSKGKPLHGVRYNAAKLLLEMGVKIIGESAEAKARATQAAAGPTTAITIQMGDKPPDPPA